MKITKTQLKQIIKEELGKVMEGGSWHGMSDLEGGPEEDIQDAIQMLEGSTEGEVSESVVQMLKQHGIQAAEKAIQILEAEVEAEEDTTGTFFHVINRLDTALQKMGDPSQVIASYPDPSGVNPPQEIYQWQQDEFDARQRAYKAFNKRNKK